MTAINLYLAVDAAHFFTDGGNYDAETLEFRHLGGKLFPLPQFDAVISWSGPSALIAPLIPAIERVGATSLGYLLACLADAVHSLRCPDRFSVIAAGVQGGKSLGIAIQEGGRANILTPGNSVKSVPTTLSFDPADIAGSGLAIMQDQRSSGVVHGYCLHTIVRPGHLVSKVLERWSE
jgi:hypothetical protein